MTKEDVLQIEHYLLSALDSIGTMNDIESFKAFGFMSGVSQMADEIIKLIDEEIKRGGLDAFNRCRQADKNN